MISTAPARTLALTALIMTGLTLTATAQPPQSVPHPGSKMLLAQAEEPQTRGPAEEEDQQGAPERPGMNAPGMMPPGMMAERMRRMMHGAMHRRLMLKIMFAIADTDEDGSVSFEEISAIHKRIFDMIDTNKDGKVTLEEMEAFMEN